MAVTHDPVTRGGEYRDRPRRWRTMSLRDVIFSALPKIATRCPSFARQ
jgi:hypothetical protein